MPVSNPNIIGKTALAGTGLIAGQTLGRYQLVEQCGAGGMGIVFRAYDHRLERNVALKVLQWTNCDDPIARGRFRNEALILSRLNHPNIATIYDFETQDGIDFLTMEFVQGETLSIRLQGGALPEKEVLSIGNQIACALEETHEQNIIHRDLKPCNVLLTRNGGVKVVDFGLARTLQALTDECATESLLQADFGAGTVPYMAPEQLRSKPMDARSDIWAMGCVLYEMATGSRPFGQSMMPALTDAIFYQQPVAPRIRNGSTSPELEVVILKCLHKDLKDRYQAAKELRRDLQMINDHRPSITMLESNNQTRTLDHWSRLLLLPLVKLLPQQATK